MSKPSGQKACYCPFLCISSSAFMGECPKSMISIAIKCQTCNLFIVPYMPFYLQISAIDKLAFSNGF